MAVGIYLSGGADSALLLYKQTEPVVCLTVASRERNHYVEASRAVVDWIRNNTDVNILEHVVAIAHDEPLRKTKRKHARGLLEKNYTITEWLGGKTMNPPVKLKHHEQRKLDRDAELPGPFGKLNKLDIYSEYQNNNIMNLWKLTVSCEVSNPPCNNCWWCMERSWAVESWSDK
tara:strand:- start:836 stop:1357 length:522 start_codon:yes stop_codon:yes gene_type:complete